MLQIPARHVIFDLDGVLVDNAWVIAGCQAEALAALGIVLELAEVRRRYGGLSPAAMAGPVAAELGRPLPNGWVSQLEEAKGQWVKNNARAVVNAAQTVRLLQAKGVRTTAVSRAPLDQITVPLGMTGLLGLFTPRLYSAAMLERDDHHPGLYDLASRQSGIVRNQTAVVTSAPAAVRAAVATDLAVFALGMDPDVDEAALKAAGATLFYDLRALPRLLRLAGKRPGTRPGPRLLEGGANLPGTRVVRLAARERWAARAANDAQTQPRHRVLRVRQALASEF